MFISLSLKRLLVASVMLLSAISCQPSSQFTLLDGEKKSLNDYQGQWLLINFWAEWCPPCLKEIPELNRLQQEGINVLAVSYDKLSNHELQKLKQKYRIDYPVIATSPMPYLPMERPSGLPANYLFTPEGQMIGPLLGTQTHDSFMEIINKVEASRTQAAD